MIIIIIIQGIKSAAEIYKYAIDILKKNFTKRNNDLSHFDLQWNYEEMVVETLYESYINLLRYHARNNVFALREIHRPLLSAMTLFPDHVYFTREFVRLISAANIAGLMWRRAAPIIKAANTSTMWLELMQAEVRRKEILAKFIQQSRHVIGITNTGNNLADLSIEV